MKVDSLEEVHCIKCGELESFVAGNAPSRFVCSDCMEKERGKE